MPAAPTRVLIAGGGFAGVEALLALRQLAGDHVSIDMISAADSLAYRPDSVREPFGLGDVEHIPLAPLCSAHDATLGLARVMGVNVPGRRVETDRLGSIAYDILLLAIGARRQPVVPGALTFDGTRGVVELRRLVERAAAGEIAHMAFVVPTGVSWPLPLYELALLTSAHLRRAGASVKLDVVTPEREPLSLLGAPASARVRYALAAAGIGIRPTEDLHRLRDAAKVALPRVVGPHLQGLRMTQDGFIPVDGHGLVEGTAQVYAAGDATDFPVKQGGLATQQAEAAAAHIAARAGAPVDADAFAPVLRAVLLTGGSPLHLLGGPDPDATADPLGPPAGKVIGRRLSRWLAPDAAHDRRVASLLTT